MTKPRQKKLTAPEAIIYAMLTASAVDRVIKDSELAVIGSVVEHLPVFAGYDKPFEGQMHALERIATKAFIDLVRTIRADEIPMDQSDFK